MNNCNGKSTNNCRLYQIISQQIAHPKKIPPKFGTFRKIAYICTRNQNNRNMTTIELRTSIVEDLDQMSVEMLESVSRYVKRLRRHSCPLRRSAAAHDTQAADDTTEISPRAQRFQRGNPWYATDEEVDKLRQEYLMEKYK